MAKRSKKKTKIKKRVIKKIKKTEIINDIIIKTKKDRC
tara:strand:+ start:386 stop:499 length:114 start_codon:yes stop_codon:yes gene_type:complete